MANFAELDENNIVINVIAVSNEDINDPDNTAGKDNEGIGLDFLEGLYGHRNFKQTSKGRNFRYNYAGIGFSYDSENDVFIEPQPEPYMTLNDSYQWVEPERPADDVINGGEKKYVYNLETSSWEELV